LTETIPPFWDDRFLEPSDFLILDRRRRSLDSIPKEHDAIVVINCHQVRSPLGGTVWVAVARMKVDRGVPPRSLAGRYRRILDRFYLPTIPDPGVAVALFDLAAEWYDSLVSIAQNVHTIKTLLSFVVSPGDRGRRILDFGCGTGLALDALAQMGQGRNGVRLIGTDPSPAMLARASARGMRVLPWQEWQKAEDPFDGAIASYVLHLGITNHELRHLLALIRRSGVFAANFHGALEPDLNALSVRLRDIGAEVTLLPQRNPTEGPIVVCTQLQ
jgi:SAM-dependent methyltransferase